MIGYYIHHQGRGHLHRAVAIQRATAKPVTGISSLPRPAEWRGPWLRLADDASPEPTSDPTVRGFLHYAPDHHPGLRSRMAALSAWAAEVRPSVVVVDVSVEVALLLRLHGVPVVTMAQPGRRSDPVHTLGYGVSDTVVAPWPASAAPMWRARVPRQKVLQVGAISRFPVAPAFPVVPGRVVVLNGAGGGGLSQSVTTASQATPGWDWVLLDRAAGTWTDDPWPLICSAQVVVSHCGQNALAEIAAARRPAVLIPQDRPFDEQRWSGDALSGAGRWPVEVLAGWPPADAWPALLDRAAAREGAQWAAWNDGHGADRVAELLDAYVTGLAVPA